MTSFPDYHDLGVRSHTSQSQASAISGPPKLRIPTESQKTAPETLKVGDIVYLATEVGSEEAIDPGSPLDSVPIESLTTRVCLHAEGVADPTVCVIPLQNGARNPKVSLSLFRVERCLYDISATPKFTKDYLARNRGEDVQYGDTLQLCHLHSKGYLRFSTDPADALGCHLVYIGSKAGNNTLIQVRAEGKQGQPVYLQDSVNLVVRCEFLDYFLHVKSQPQGYRLVASTHEFSWRFYEFCELSGNKNELLTNVPITLTHKGLGLNMSYEGPKNTDWKEGYRPESPVLRSKGDLGESGVSLKNDRFDHQAYWTLEDPDEFLGGPVQAGKGYYLKHIHTGMYLSGDLTLQSCPLSMFYLQPRRGTGEKLYSGCEVQIEDDRKCRLESGVEKFGLENLHLIPSPARKKGDKRKVDLFINETSPNAEKSIFEVQNVGKLANFITWTNEMMPVFGRFYALLTIPAQRSDSFLEIHRKTQKKELIRHVEIVKNAFQAINDEIDNSGDVMERLKKKQFLSIGLKIHVIAVDLAKTMIKRLRKEEADGLMAGEMNKLFPVMMSVLNTIAKDNKWTCKALSRLDLQLCEIFPYHKKLMGSLLGEIYRMINPSHPEEHFERLCDLLTTVKEENVEEQTLYLTLLRHLSEDDETVTLASQKILTAYFLRSEKPFFFLKLLMKDGVPYVEFMVQDGETTEEEMIRTNPALKSLLETINCAPHFSLVALTRLETYISYASQAVLLLNTLCKGDNQQVIGILRNVLGFDVRSMLTMVQDERLHPSFRGSVISLLDTIVLDRSRKVPFTTRQSNLSFRLEEVAGRVTMDEGNFARGKREEVSQVAQWCLRFWARKDPGTDLFASGTLPLLDYLHAVLTMTYTLINYHYATPSFVRAVNPAILDLLISLLSSQLEFHAERQWIQGIKNVLKEGYSEIDFDFMHKVKKVQDLTIRLIKLNLDMDLRAKTEQLLKIFYHHKESWYSPEEEDMIRHEVRDVVTGVTGKLDLSGKMIFLFKQNPAEAKRQQAYEAILDILIREPHIKEFLCSAVLSDLQLAASTRQELLWLLYQILESDNVLLRMLKTVDLIEEPELLERRKFLSDFKKDFSIANNVNTVRDRLLIDPQEAQRLATILERLLSVLSLKTTKPGLFKKTQNLARSYQVHEELLAFWHVLIVVEAAPALVDLVCICLVNFCYGNDSNRNELLASVDSRFFSLVSTQTPYLIQEISNFEQMPQTHAERGICYILQKCVCASPALRPGLEWVRAMISYRGQQGFKKDLQTLACFLLMDRINVLHLSLNSDSWDMGQIILLLSDCAHGNPVTIGHCRQVAGVSEVLEGFKNAKSPLMLRAWVAFFLEVYANDVPSEDFNDSCVAEIVEIVVLWVGKTVDSLKVIEAVVNAGAYEQIWNERKPYCCFFEDEKVWYKEAELWRMLSCGEPWQHNTGLLVTLPKILSRLPIHSYRLQALCQALQRLMEEVRSGLFLLKASNPLLNIDTVLRTVQQFLSGQGTNSSLKSTPPVSPEIFLELNLKAEAASHRKTTSDTSTIVFQSEESTPKKTNSTNNEVEPHFQAFVDLAAGVIGEYAKDYHVTFREMALMTHPMKFFKKKHLAGSKRTELVKMLKLLNTKISPTLKFMIFDLLDSVIREVPDKPAISKVFIDSGLVEAAVSAIVEQPNFRLMKSAVAFLNGLFEKQSAEFLIWFLEKLKVSGAYLRLFAQLKAELGCSLDRIIMRGSDPDTEKHLTAYERDIFSGLLQSGSPLSDVFELAKDYSINLVRFMQLCCDNCNLPFQEFMNAQTTSGGVQRGSVNVVETIANYVIVVSQYEALFTEDSEAKSTLIVSLEALLDFVTGPCILNQDKLGTDIQFLLALNRILKVCAGHKDDIDWVVMYSKTLDFLMSLFEGSPSEAVLNSLIQYLDLAFLLSDMENIYAGYIKGKEQDLLLESPNAAPIAQVGFKIAILASFFQYYFHRHPELATFSIANIKEKPNSSFDLMKFWVTKGLPEDCVAFFYAFIGYVEIARNGRIESHYFQIPFACKFLTQETKESIIINANRSSQQEKVESFLDMVSTADVEMRHQQNLYRIPGIKYFSEGWQLCGWAAFILVVVINLVVLADTEGGQIADGDPWIKNKIDGLTVVVNILQIVMMLLSYTFFLIEYYPNIVAGEMIKRASLEFPQYSSIRHNDSLLMSALTNGSKTPTQFDQISTGRKLFLLAKNGQNLSFCVYLIVSILSFWWRFLYCFLLLDIFKRSPELGNILRAITLNRRQLILTSIFWILLVYIFSGIALYQFSNYYNHINSMYCSDYWECFISTLHMGVRYGGGIGEPLEDAQIEDPRYYSRVLFDLLFFAIINLIIQNIIFGIIVDTFGELRDNRNAMLEDINQKCYICGSARSEIERNGTGWSYHFLNEHSPFAYLAFIKYVQTKEMNECNGLEKFVKEKLIEKDSCFFPTSSRLIMASTMSETVDRKKRFRFRAR